MRAVRYSKTRRWSRSACPRISVEVNDRARILCPTDFSEPSAGALEFAASLAERLGAELHLLHVYHLPLYALPQVMPLPTPDFAAELARAVNASLAALVEQLAGRGISAVPHLAEGVPYEVIVDKAVELGAEQIVMGTHGRTGLGHALLGSIAERVVRASPVPVTTVRAP